MYITFAAIVTLFGGVLPALHFERHQENLAVRLGIIGVGNFLVALGFAYLATPFFYGPFWGATYWVLGFGAANVLLAGVIVSRKAGKPTIPHGAFYMLICVLIFGFTQLIGSSALQADHYRNLLGRVEERNWDKDLQPVDLTHIVVVSQEQAEVLGNKVIGESRDSLGSRYEIGDYHIQRVRGELYWVAPLEFRGFSKWQQYGHTPGFVMVSAEDRNRPAELFDTFKLRYMPSAFFGDHLRRYLYGHGYGYRGLTEYTFELNEDLKPYWVITVFHPAIYYSGEVVDGVVIVDPETGMHQFYNAGEVPDWVDRVYAEEIVEDQITWWGEYVRGWVNSWWGQDSVEIPTPFGDDSNDVNLVYGLDGQPYWFTGLTSVSSKDQSLTGFIMVNSRTGQSALYRITGANEQGVMEAVNNKVSNYEGYRGVQPILYNIYGELTWVVPVIGSKNILQKVAFVRATNLTVEIGDDVADVARKYRTFIASSGFSMAPTSAAKRVTRSGLRITRKSVEPFKDTAMYYFYFEDIPHKIFVAASNVSPELSVSNVGDPVTLTYIDTEESLIPLEEFDNEALAIHPSLEQTELTERRAGVEYERETRDIKKELKQGVEDLSPEQLRKMKEAKEKGKIY